MKEITLPEKEETIIRLTVGGSDPIEFDFFEFDELNDECMQEVAKLGVAQDQRAYIDIFIKKFQERFSVELSPLSAVEFIDGALQFGEEVKKKYFDRSGYVDSTESTPSDSSNPKDPKEEPSQKESVSS